MTHTPTARPALAPRVDGDLPGPRSAEFLEHQRRWESNARVYPRNLPIAIAGGTGSYLWDVDGNVFIDFLAGAGVLSLGHNHPEVVRAATEQLQVLTHGLDFPTPAKREFIDAQLSMLPPGLRARMRMHFCGPGGANAVDAAVKLCKTATGRGDLVSFQGGFHGSSHAAMALTGLVAQKRPIANGVPGVHFFPYSYCTRCPVGLSPDNCETNCMGLLERSLRDPNGGIPLPAAVILEIVQGEGGVVPASRDFVHRVCALTTELDIPLVVDEVQTGCGRTGTWFAFEQYDIEPDVIVASKALSGMGLPVALIFYDQRLRDGRPAHRYARAVQAYALRHGLIIELGGRGDSVVRLMPPLTVTAEVIDLAGTILLDAIEHYSPAADSGGFTKSEMSYSP